MSENTTSLLFMKYWIYPGGDCHLRVKSKFFEESMLTFAHGDKECHNLLLDMERRINEKESKLAQEKKEVAEFDR